MKINKLKLMEEITKNVKVLKGIVIIKLKNFEFIFNKFESTTLYLTYNGSTVNYDGEKLLNYIESSIGPFSIMDSTNIFNSGEIKILEFESELDMEKIVGALKKLEEK